MVPFAVCSVLCTPWFCVLCYCTCCFSSSCTHTLLFFMLQIVPLRLPCSLVGYPVRFMCKMCDVYTPYVSVALTRFNKHDDYPSDSQKEYVSWSAKLISVTQTRLCAVELFNISKSGKWTRVLLLFPIKQPERHSHEACKTIWYISYPQSSTVQEHRQTCCIYCFCISEYNGERRATWLSLVRRVEHICMHKTV